MTGDPETHIPNAEDRRHALRALRSGAAGWRHLATQVLDPDHKETVRGWAASADRVGDWIEALPHG